MNPFDLAGSFLCLIFAVAIATVHIISSPSRPLWQNLPLDLRTGLLCSGAFLMFRCVELWFLASETDRTAYSAGHLSVTGLGTLIFLCYTFCRMAHHLACKVYPEAMWGRIQFAEVLVKMGQSALGVAALRGEPLPMVTLSKHGNEITPPDASLVCCTDRKRDVQ